jgi:hypothetical protein
VNDAPPPEPRDTGRYCPHCLYNLTGLRAHRCPECGADVTPPKPSRQRPPANQWLFYAIAIAAMLVVIVLAIMLLTTAPAGT